MSLGKPVILSLACLLAVNAQASEESIIDLRYEMPTQAQNQLPSPVQAPNCTVIVKPPQDLRRNKETLGTTFRDNPIISKQPAVDWLQDALLGLKKMGLNTTLDQPEASAQAASVTMLSTELQKMYIWNHGMNLHATLVLKARMRTGEGPEIERRYRVVGTKLNWINGDSEFVSTLNIAAARLLSQLSSDLQQECKGSAVIADN